MVNYKEQIHQALGYASMCWIPKPSTEVFDSKEASKCGEELIEQLEKNTTLAIKILQNSLKEADYYMAWQDNMAMAFKDEFERGSVGGRHVERDDIHEIANNAARNFLNLLIK